MKVEECSNIFPELKVDQGKIYYPNECKTPPCRLAYFLELHRQAIGRNEYSKYSPQTILVEEPFRSLLPSADAYESFDVIAKVFIDIRSRLCANKTKKADLFLSQLNNTKRYIFLIATSDRPTFISRFPEKNMNEILGPLYSVDNPEYQWERDLQTISSDIEKVRKSAIDLLDNLKKLDIDLELKAYLHASLLSIIKALEHYQLCGMDDIESAIAKAMLRYHSILKNMQQSENEAESKFSSEFFNLSLDILKAIKKITQRGLVAIGVYNTILEFNRNLISDWVKS